MDTGGPESGPVWVPITCWHVSKLIRNRHAELHVDQYRLGATPLTHVLLAGVVTGPAFHGGHATRYYFGLHDGSGPGVNVVMFGLPTEPNITGNFVLIKATLKEHRQQIEVKAVELLVPDTPSLRHEVDVKYEISWASAVVAASKSALPREDLDQLATPAANVAFSIKYHIFAAS